MKHIKISPKWAGACFALVFTTLFCQTLAAQQPLKLIRANSRGVTIRDGYVILNDIWSLSPEVKPDRYHALKSATEKIITFYTDIDSISFRTTPGNTYSFAVLLKGKDTCYTQIVTDGDISLVKQDKLISRELLAMDFMVFRDYMEREHAGLYRYRTKAEIDRLFDQGVQSIKGLAEKLDFGKTLMHVISEVRDGHTGTNLSSMILNTYRDSVKLFPLLLYFDKQRAFVRCSKLIEFPIGAEILSINDKKIEEIKETLFSYLPSDGQIKSKKRHTLNNGSFAFLYRLVFGESKLFSVDYREQPGGQLKTASVKASLSKDFDCELGSANRATKDLQLDHLSDDIALLTIKTFDQGRLSRSKLDFSKFLENTFNELKRKKTDKLIVDLRGNGGGFDEYGSMLYSYITEKDFGYLAAAYRANDPAPLSNNRNLGIKQPKSNSFKGEIVFLIDGLCFSASADFCAIAKSNERGKFVGEETAGAYYGNNSGKTLRLELPNTKIAITIPKFKYLNDVKKTRYTDRGVMPDYEIIQSLKEVVKERDVQMDFALTLLKGKKRKFL